MIEINGPSGNKKGTDLSIQFLGDISLNGIYCDPQHHELLTKNMAEMAEYLGSCDLRVGNLESPLWGDGTVNVLKKPRVATTAQAARCVLPLNLDVVLLANNHAFDCREKGLQNTVAFLEANDIATLGAGFSQQDASRPLVLERKGLKLGLLAYVGSETNPNLPPRSGVYLNMLDEQRAMAEVTDLAAIVDIVLVHLHWGAVELVHYPPPSHRRLARKLIDAGARIVVGGHAHCLQGHEAWNAGHIFYDLGNFLFASVTVPGKTGRDWPDYARRGGAAVCRVSPFGVKEAGLKYFHQRDLLIYIDNSSRRARQNRRLSRCLGSSENALRRRWRRDVFLQRFVMSPLRRLWQSGPQGLFKIRRRHFSSLLSLRRQIKKPPIAKSDAK